MNRRIRSYKPEFFADGKVCSLPIETRYLLLGLISIADDEGRFRAEAVTVAGAIFMPELSRNPLECLASVSRGLLALAELGILVLYETPGERYGSLVNWARHQKIDKPTKSRFPRPPEPPGDHSRESREVLASLSRPAPEFPSPGSGIVDQGSGIREQQQGPASDSTSAEEPTPTSPAATTPSEAPDPPVPAAPTINETAVAIYAFWVETFGKSGVAAKTNTAAAKVRLGHIVGRLRDGYTVEQLRAAIVGCSKSPFHNGQNTDGKVYDDLELIMRPGKIDKFIAEANRARPASAPPVPAEEQPPRVLRRTGNTDPIPEQNVWAYRNRKAAEAAATAGSGR